MPCARRALLGVLLAFAAVAASCGDDAPELGDDTATSAPPTSVAEDTEDTEGGEDDGDAAEPPAEDDSTRPPTDGTDAPGVVEGVGARVVGLLGPEGGVPLSDGDFADPFVLATGVIPVGFTSNSRAANVPVSRGGPRGEVSLGDALPEVGSWSTEGYVWAPSVLEVQPGRYVMYYTSRHTASGRQCIGAAVSDSPVGPYVDESSEPMICELAEGGSIDASPVMVDGTPWLLWKADGNCCGKPTPIRVQQLDAEGTALVGAPTELLRNDLAWEGPVVEGPSMVEVDGRLHLFWSAERWDTGNYAVGHAVCDTVTGPCHKDPEPFLVSGADFQGPGGQEVYRDRTGRTWMVFHAWLPGAVGYEGGGSRRLFVEEITFDAAGRPQLASATAPS